LKFFIHHDRIKAQQSLGDILFKVKPYETYKLSSAEDTNSSKSAGKLRLCCCVLFCSVIGCPVKNKKLGKK